MTGVPHKGVRDWIVALPERGRIGTPYMLKSSAAGSVGIDCLSEPAVNEKDMSVRMCISTDAVDREKMAIRQEGILLHAYKLNPTVLYGHGLEGIVLPVAISEDFDGNCTVTKQPGATYARAYHRSEDKVSSQMFDSVRCGLLRAASIGITPTTVGYVFDSNSKRIPVVEEGVMNEWSYCSVGVNPEAVLKSGAAFSPLTRNWLEAFALQSEAAVRILGRNTLDGVSIDPSVRRLVKALVPQRRNSGIGFSFGGKDVKKKVTAAQLKAMKPTQLLKSMAAIADYDDESQEEILKAASDFAEMDDDFETDDDDDDDDESKPAMGPEEDEVDYQEDGSMEMSDEDGMEPTTDTAGVQKAGAQVTASLHAGVADLLAKINASIGMVEHPEVGPQLETIIETLRDVMSQCEGIMSSTYPEAPALDSSEAEVEVGDEMLKSFLAGSKRKQVQLIGIANRLGVVAKNVENKQLRKSLLNTQADLSRIVASARGESPASKSGDASPSADLTGMVAGLEAKFAKLMESLDNTPAKVARISSV